MDSGKARFLRMVGWYDPRLLARTGVQVAISTIFGRHSDRRLVEAIGSGPMEFYDYSCGPEARVVRRDDPAPESPPPRRGSICIDYAADVGDGWNSTYTIARAIAEAHQGAPRKFQYRVAGETKEVSPPRGDVLVLGGDEVYPVASREAYETRLHAPYRAALRCSQPPHPDVYAVPGNHDWYDSLVSFTRLFGPGRWLGGWRSLQTRSYFALKLPHDWWLIGTDVQLGSDIDRPQVEYFKWIARQMTEGARVILCTAEPYWIVAEKYGEMDPEYNESNLAFLEKKVLGRRVNVFIAGDLHHYRRHESLDGRRTQKITAGGGGAFLHPTHSGRLNGAGLNLLKESVAPPAHPCPDGAPPPRQPPPPRVFKHQASYPPEEISRRLCWLNPVFPFLPGNASRLFGALTSGLYFLTTLAVLRSGPGADASDFREFLGRAATIAWDSSFTLTLVGIILAGFLFFTDTHSLRYRFLMGLPHGVAHLFVAFSAAFLSVYASKLLISGGSMYAFSLRVVLAGILVLALGFVLGPVVMGTYLLISLNLFGRHSNEAFSSLAVEDWKSFLKLHIQDGELTIYPIGVRRVARKWKPNPDDRGSEYLPDDEKATPPQLIEPPVRVGAVAERLS